VSPADRRSRLCKSSRRRADILAGMPRRLLACALLLTACPDSGDDTGDGTTTLATTAPATSFASTSTSDPSTISTTDTPTTDAPTTDTSTSDTSTSSTTDDPTASTDTGDPVMPTVLLPRASIEASELAILANDQDPQSMAVAAYYATARQIPPENIITLSFAPAGSIPAATFARLKAQTDAALPADIQALAIAWTTPYLVDCQSLVSSFALGHDPAKYCSQPCNETAPSGYYDSPSFQPFTDHGLRPAMHLAGVSAEDVQALVDRGVSADATFPTGVGYFIRTTDVDRSVRWPDQLATQGVWDHPGGLDLEYLDNSTGGGLDYIENRTDVLFYLTGLASVPQIATNTYLPGAVADHLTSYGGQIPDSGQMSVVRWLEAGATASYGTGVEPCNYPTKFPVASVLLPHYYRGETVIEAYWKSVAWPGEGVFVGEPLARPWGVAGVEWQASTLTIRTTQLVPLKPYRVESAPAADGPWTLVQDDITIPDHQLAQVVIPDATAPFYRLIPVP